MYVGRCIWFPKASSTNSVCVRAFQQVYLIRYANMAQSNVCDDVMLVCDVK